MRARTYILLVLTLAPAPLLSAEATLQAKTIPAQDRIETTRGKTLEGTILLAGKRGYVILVDDADIFVPAALIKKVERESERNTPGKPASISLKQPLLIKKYSVGTETGEYRIRGEASGLSPAADGEETEPAEDAPPPPETPNPAVKKANEKMRKAEKLLRGGVPKKWKEAEKRLKTARGLLKSALKAYKNAAKSGTSPEIDKGMAAAKHRLKALEAMEKRLRKEMVK